MTTSENPRPISPRSQSRRYAALALYQWRLTGDDPMAIKRHLLDDPKWLDAVAASLNGVSDEDELAVEDRFNFNVELLDELLSGVPTHIEAIDAQLDRFLDRPISQVDPVELAILRLGAYEILFSDNIPGPGRHQRGRRADQAARRPRGAQVRQRRARQDRPAQGRRHGPQALSRPACPSSI
jgi:transcription antitermination protein NusB